jgi:hypothetical protein
MEQICRGRSPWVACLDQYGTWLAYHGLSESHMKTVGVVPKYPLFKHLTRHLFRVRTIGESRAKEKL